MIYQTHQGALARAVDDYIAALGTVRDSEWVYGYRGDDSVEVHCDPPAKVRILPTSDEDVQHTVDAFVDPYWDVELAEPHPALADVRSLWIYGPSHEFERRRDSR